MDMVENRNGATSIKDSLGSGGERGAIGQEKEKRKEHF